MVDKKSQGIIRDERGQEQQLTDRHARFPHRPIIVSRTEIRKL